MRRLRAYPVLMLFLLAGPGVAAPAKPPSAVAFVGDKAISDTDFRRESAAAFDALRKQQTAQSKQLEEQQAAEIAAMRERELRALLDRKALELEGRSTGRDGLAVLGDLIVEPVSDAEARAFYLDHQSQIQQPYAEIRSQIVQLLQNQRTDLETRRFSNQLWLKHGIRPVEEPKRTVIDGLGPVRGAAGAAVTIVEFSDFQCPFCVRTAPELQRVLQAYPEHVRLVYRQLPLRSLHAQAQAAAEASLCAHDQGRFWDMHDALFALAGHLDEGTYGRLAESLALDSKAFGECMEKHRNATAVEADIHEADRIGAGGTPYLLINGRALNGAASFADIAMMVEDELVRRGIPSPVPVQLRRAN